MPATLLVLAVAQGGQPSSEDNQYIFVRWMLVLLAIILGAGFTTVVDNLAKGAYQRLHNDALLGNEILAEHQSAYVLFFMALFSGTDFKPSWIKTTVFGAVMLLAFIMYALAVRNTSKHEAKISAFHTCSHNPCPGLDFSTHRKLAIFNAISAILLAGVSIVLTCFALKPPP